MDKGVRSVLVASPSKNDLTEDAHAMQTKFNVIKAPRMQYFNAVLSNRRQIQELAELEELPLEPEVLAILTGQVSGRIEDYFEPYWQDGQWVFLRTPRPNAVVKRKERWLTTLKYVCAHRCSKMIQDYGFVCGVRIDRIGFRYEYKVFKDMCDLEEANCERPQHDWRAIHRGSCPESTQFHSQYAELSTIKMNKYLWAPLAGHGK